MGSAWEDLAYFVDRFLVGLALNNTNSGQHSNDFDFESQPGTQLLADSGDSLVIPEGQRPEVPGNCFGMQGTSARLTR